MTEFFTSCSPIFELPNDNSRSPSPTWSVLLNDDDDVKHINQMKASREGIITVLVYEHV